MRSLIQTFLAGLAGALAVGRPGPTRKLLILQSAMMGSLVLMARPVPVMAQLTVERTIFVSGAGVTANLWCDELRDLLNGLPAATSFSSYLIKVGPGVMDCGTNPLGIPAWVTVEGAGRNATFIRGEIDSTAFGVVDFEEVGGASLRSLSVRNWGSTNTDAVAVSVFDSSVTLEDVILTAPSGPKGSSVALAVFAVPDSIISEALVWNSELDGPTAVRTVDNGGAAWPTFHGTQIRGNVDTSSGGLARCGACYDASFDPLDRICLPPPPP